MRRLHNEASKKLVAEVVPDRNMLGIFSFFFQVEKLFRALGKMGRLFAMQRLIPLAITPAMFSK